ncbi:MAG: hypothetical protein JNL32_14675 [Candidatus Kapabacteria bacterium]|nr:hypothetical protein [Candidatus Kapabacteria bacterium]
MSGKATYTIRIHGKLDVHWESRFEPLVLTRDGDFTILHGEVVDQAMLFGIITKIQSLGLELFDLCRTPSFVNHDNQ